MYIGRKLTDYLPSFNPTSSRNLLSIVLPPYDISQYILHRHLSMPASDSNMRTIHETIYTDAIHNGTDFFSFSTL
jgi:hypothetical protein